MSIESTFRNFASGLIGSNKRPVDLYFGLAQRAAGHLLARHHADIRDGLISGIDGQPTCVSTRDPLSPALFLGLPVPARLTTDRGGRRAINAIVRDIRVASGTLSNLTTDAAGELPAVDADRFEKLAVQFIKKNV
ncbi:hypothetical protein LMG29660_02201 [Burkholderia puraquae]|uniref:Uncharacterized protein n=1 Tax=Burkholderia puraquae TaxID=1904757 RepID=A0A6J5DHP0_9BURK|nr:hypothetical protein [Burkholderia puraquae]CAB3753750.1 hypothetical protein LMG29660_02201 [Burkholderia puraquae]